MIEDSLLTFEKILLSNPLMATVKLARFKFVSKMLDKNDIGKTQDKFIKIIFLTVKR